MDLDAAAAELYGGSPDDFVERRKALVAEARRARDRELVAALGKLRRPTRTAWLVNLLAREAATEVAALLELGDALADAQRRSSGPDLRRLSGERRTLVDRLARQAVALGADHGYLAPDAALQEVSQTLQAALGDEATRDQLRTGRLTAALSYGGFGFALPDPDPAPAPEPEEPEPPAPEPTEPEPDPLAAQREEAERAWQEAQQAEAEADREAEAATARADALADRIEELRGELAAAEEAEATAREEARAARRALQQVRRLAAEAQQAREALGG